MIEEQIIIEEEDLQLLKKKGFLFADGEITGIQIKIIYIRGDKNV